MAYHGKYKSPSDLMADQDLSDNEKIYMLEQWRDDKEALIRASEEGMEGMEGSDYSDILKEVNKALISLRKGKG